MREHGVQKSPGSNSLYLLSRNHLGHFSICGKEQEALHSQHLARNWPKSIVAAGDSPGSCQTHHSLHQEQLPPTAAFFRHPLGRVKGSCKSPSPLLHHYGCFAASEENGKRAVLPHAKKISWRFYFLAYCSCH